jgi:hypothetical protein
MRSLLRILAVSGLFCSVFVNGINAQTFNVSINQDPFFGFYPSVSGSTKLDDHLDFTFYGTFWTTPALGAGGNGGNLWTEFGIGANFKVLDDKLEINPSIGTTHGSLQSAGVRGIAFEGIVPNLIANLNTEKFEGQLYAGYYLSLRQKSTVQNNFLHYWLHAGYKISNVISAGFHFENLDGTVIPASGDSQTNRIYTWYGPYIQFKGKAGHSLRLSAGGAAFGPSSKSENGEFYKMALIIPFAM